MPMFGAKKLLEEGLPRPHGDSRSERQGESTAAAPRTKNLGVSVSPRRQKLWQQPVDVPKVVYCPTL